LDSREEGNNYAENNRKPLPGNRKKGIRSHLKILRDESDNPSQRIL
jgi:hypothetical protein